MFILSKGRLTLCPCSARRTCTSVPRPSPAGPARLTTTASGWLFTLLIITSQIWAIFVFNLFTKKIIFGFTRNLICKDVILRWARGKDLEHRAWEVTDRCEIILHCYHQSSSPSAVNHSSFHPNMSWGWWSLWVKSGALYVPMFVLVLVRNCTSQHCSCHTISRIILHHHHALVILSNVLYHHQHHHYPPPPDHLHQQSVHPGKLGEHRGAFASFQVHLFYINSRIEILFKVTKSILS